MGSAGFLLLDAVLLLSPYCSSLFFANYGIETDLGKKLEFLLVLLVLSFVFIADFSFSTSITRFNADFFKVSMS